MKTENAQEVPQPRRKRWLSGLLNVLGRAFLLLLETVAIN